MSKAITDLLTYRAIPVSSSYVEHLIASHSEYPSLLSIVDTLNRLGIPNIAAKIDKEQLTELEFPYVLQLHRQKDLILIKGARDLEKNKEKIEDWNGIVFHAEPTKTISDPENNRLYKRERIFSFLTYAAALMLLIPFAWSAFTAPSIFTTIIALAAMAGLVIGYVLIGKDLGVKFDAVENFCTPAGKRNTCDAILESEGASFFGFLKLSDLVFIYFLCQVCCVAALAVVPAWSGSILQCLAVLSIVAAPMVVYSVFYQWKASSWCKLCLIVDGILLLQAALFLIPGDAFVQALHPSVVAAVAAGSFIVATAVILFKGKVEDTMEFRKSSSDAMRMKNSELIFSHLSSQEEDELPFDGDLRLISGNKNAPLKFVMAGNLHCGPCGIQHEKIEELVDLYPDLVSVEYRFVPPKDKDEKINSVQYILEYWRRNIRNRDNERELLKEMITDWYEWIDLEKFRKKYVLGDESISAEALAMEKAQMDWRNRQTILRTPTIFLNGRKLPKEYWPADFKVMIPSLATLEQAKVAAAPVPA